MAGVSEIRLLTTRPPRPRRLRLAMIVLALIVGLTLAAPFLATHDPRQAASPAFEPPSSAHLLGTDTLGRDVFSRLLWGGRQTLLVALLATAISLLPGTLLGLIAGYLGGWPDHLLMAGMDVLLSFPSLLLALALITIGGAGVVQVAIAVGIAGLPPFARVARVAVLDVRGRLYVDAAISVGAPHRRILLRHVLPNILDTLLSFGALTLSWAVLNGAALAFLGFAGDPATPDWGSMLNEGRTAFRLAPWIALPPGIAITLTVYAVTRLADSVQEAVNPG
jgi:peptide/nickel transport system permease protein